MQRRDILKTLPAIAASATLTGPVFAQRERVKIREVRLVRIRVVRELGTFISEFRVPAVAQPVRVGGWTMVEIVSDSGHVGIGHGFDPAHLEAARGILVGKDPFEIENLARMLAVQGRWGAGAEIALWDLVGKIAEQPLVKLWGGGMTRVMPYGALYGLGDGPEERARAAAQVKADGFAAVKVRSSFPTQKEDIRLVERTRRAVGDDFPILVDANKAGPYTPAQLATLWDYQRAFETARAFEDLGVYWLEEPLDRYDYEGLAELNRSLNRMRLAGGEANAELSEYRRYLEVGAYDVLNCDCIVLGPRLYRQAQNLAFAFNRRVVPHALGVLPVICHLHLAASHPQPIHGDKHFAPHLEMVHNPPLHDHRQMWEVFVNPPALDADGYMTVPAEPGLGVTINPDLIEPIS